MLSFDRGRAKPAASGSTDGAAPAHALSFRTVDDRVDEVGPVLDALGSILTAISRHAFDLPDRSAEQVSSELQRWQRHAILGVPVAPHGGGSVGVRDRDWDGIARTFTEHRRDEARYVDTAIHELLAFKARQSQMHSQYQSLAGRIENLGHQLEEAKRESTTDALTGLGNRKLFDAMSHRAVHLHALSCQPVVLVLVDLDKFKMVNDTYGHQVGDQTLVAVARCLSKVFMRQSDVVCRYGGDEFAAVLNNTDIAIAHALARRLVAALGLMPLPHPAMEFAVAASIGLAEYDGEESLGSWIARADGAMYEAKGSGGDRIVVARARAGES